jgi:hypothetical protein
MTPLTVAATGTPAAWPVGTIKNERSVCSSATCVVRFAICAVKAVPDAVSVWTWLVSAVTCAAAPWFAPPAVCTCELKLLFWK